MKKKQDDFTISFKDFTYEELLKDKDFLKILNNYWDKSFYRYSLEQQEIRLVGWILDTMITLDNPKWKDDKQMQSYFKRKKVMCKTQLLRVYKKQKAIGVSDNKTI